MFQLKTATIVRLVHLTCRTEAAGKKKDVPAVTLRLKLEGVENTILDQLSPTFRHTAYAPIEGQPTLPDVPETTPILRSKDLKRWAPEELAFHGWKVLIDHGIDETDPIRMDKTKIDGFAVDLYEGGRVDVEFRVSTSDIDSEGVGILWAQQKQQFPVTIIAPELPANGGTEATGAAIDGTKAAFNKDHPGFDFDAENGGQRQGDDDGADSEGGATDATPEGAFAAAVATETGAAEQAEIEAGMTASVEKARKSKKKLDDAGNPFGAAGTVQ